MSSARETSAPAPSASCVTRALQTGRHCSGVALSRSFVVHLIRILVSANLDPLLLDGTELMGERIIVQFARGGNRPRDDAGYAAPRVAPRPRRTLHRMTVMGLPLDTSWQVRNPRSAILSFALY